MEKQLLTNRQESSQLSCLGSRADGNICLRGGAERRLERVCDGGCVIFLASIFWELSRVQKTSVFPHSFIFVSTRRDRSVFSDIPMVKMTYCHV